MTQQAGKREALLRRLGAIEDAAGFYDAVDDAAAEWPKDFELRDEIAHLARMVVGPDAAEYVVAAWERESVRLVEADKKISSGYARSEHKTGGAVVNEVLADIRRDRERREAKAVLIASLRDEAVA
jgi:hypothetical protein